MRVRVCVCVYVCESVCLCMCVRLCVCVCVSVHAMLWIIRLVNLQKGSWSNLFYAIAHQPELIFLLVSRWRRSYNILYFSSVVSDRTSSWMSPESILWNLCKIFVTASEGRSGRQWLQESVHLVCLWEFVVTNVFVSEFETQTRHHVLQISYRNMAIPFLHMPYISKNM